VNAVLEQRLAVVIGKGGTGRTTVSAVLATIAARRGLRVLLCEIHGRDRAVRLLGHGPIGPGMVEVRERLFVANVTPEAALEEYVTGVLRSRRLYRSLFGRPAVRAFVRAVPGLDDLMMIGKVRFHAEELAGGRPRWDLVVVDAPATGNGLFFLEVPDAVLRVVERGPLAHYARKQRALLQDPRRTAAHLVTLAEEMSVVETLELARALRERVHVPIGATIVNRVRPAPLDGGSRSLLERVAPGDPVLDRHLAAARWALARFDAQQAQLAALRRSLPLQRALLALADVPEPAMGPAAVERLADELEPQLVDRDQRGTPADPGRLRRCAPSSLRCPPPR
jgi:anion-transporting  ArsA/GET3 family ATPase